MKFIVKKFADLSKTELYEILKVRAQIFIVEQKMNCQDLDGVDFDSLHMFLEENGKIIAYLRAYESENDSNTVKIGRVLTLRHGMGYGRELLEKSILELRENYNYKRIVLNSQITAVGFYEKLGFKVISDEFLEEGIIHFAMEYEI